MQRVIIPNVCEDELIGGNFNHLVQVVEQTRQTNSGDTVVWDFREVTFLHPFFLAPLAIFRQQADRDILCENITLQMQSYLNGILNTSNKTIEAMTQTIKLYDIYHADLFSRAKASQLTDHICSEADTIIIDFDGITFMSRSFADELYNIVIDFPNKTFHYHGCNNDVSAMMKKVAEGRTHERRLGIPPAQMLSFDSQSKLSDFLVAQ